MNRACVLETTTAALLTLSLMATLGATGCNGDRPGPTDPSHVQSTGATNPTNPATSYLDSLIKIMQEYSIKTARIDWGSFRAEVLAAAGPAQTIPGTYEAIELAVRLLNDTQTYYMGRNGQLIGPQPVGGCTAPTPITPGLPDTVAYIKVASCDCSGSAATQFAESLQRAIRNADHPGLSGWIVDLRGNFGGNMWPMIAGVGPILDEEIVGWIVYNDREYEREYRNGGAQSFGEVFAKVGVPYTLLREHPKVAVLTDGGVASSGEAITVFFRGRPNTRSFGTPTCGHHHLQQMFTLSDGATLALAVSEHADRTKRQYAGRINPDELVADPEQVVSRAIVWLQEGS
jgi:hypothetical protein